MQGLGAPISRSLGGSQVLVYEDTYSPGHDIYVVGLAEGISRLSKEQKETLRDFNQSRSTIAIARQLNLQGGCIYQSLTDGYRTVKTLILMRLVMPAAGTANDSSFCYSAGVFHHLGARGAVFRSIDDMYPAEAGDGQAKLIPFMFGAPDAAISLLYAGRARPDAPGFAGGEDRQTALERVRLILSFVAAQKQRKQQRAAASYDLSLNQGSTVERYREVYNVCISGQISDKLDNMAGSGITKCH